MNGYGFRDMIYCTHTGIELNSKYQLSYYILFGIQFGRFRVGKTEYLVFIQWILINKKIQLLCTEKGETYNIHSAYGDNQSV